MKSMLLLRTADLQVSSTIPNQADAALSLSEHVQMAKVPVVAVNVPFNNLSWRNFLRKQETMNALQVLGQVKCCQ